MNRMRTVLATDEMLAHAVKRMLPGKADIVGHIEMRDLGRKLLGSLRDRLLGSPSVLVIGGCGWNALPLLRRLRLPASVPVVLIAQAETEWSSAQAASRLRVYSTVATGNRFTGVASAVATECQLAWVGRHAEPRSRSYLVAPAPRLDLPLDRPLSAIQYLPSA